MSDAQALVDQHIASKKRLKLVRIVGPLVMVLVVVIGIWSIVSMVTSIDTDVLTEELQREGERVRPKVQETLIASGKRIQPLVREEFAKYQKEQGPALEGRLNNEVKELEGSVQEHLTVSLNEGLRKATSRQREALLKEFPSLKGDTAAQNEILEAASEGASMWAKDELTGSLNGHISAMTNLRDTLNKSYGPTSDGAAIPPTAVTMMYLELMADTLGDDSTILEDDGSGKPTEIVVDKKKAPRKPKPPAEAPSGDDGGQ